MLYKIIRGIIFGENKKLRKKIIIINHYGATPDMPGATKHYYLAKYFADKEEYDVEFWMCGYNHHTGSHHPSLNGLKIQSTEITDGFKSVRIKSIPYRNSKIARQLNTVVFDVITGFKLFFKKNVAAVVISIPPNNIFNVFATKVRNISVVMDLEDIWPLFLQDMGLKNTLAISFMEKSANYFYNNADRVLAVSQGMVDFVKDKVSKPENVYLAPLGVNLREYSNIKFDNTLFFDKLWKDDFVIMYIGAHGRANDLESVLKTVKVFNNIYNDKKRVSFVFVGDGVQKKSLLNLKNELYLKNVHFEDAIPGRLVPNYLKRADICLTNLKKVESFKLVRPNKLFQYMAMAKPVICGIWGEAKDIIEEANAGIYIDFTQNKTAASSIVKLIDDEEKLCEFGQNGLNYIEEHGDRRKIFSTNYQIIKDLIEGK